MVIDLARARGVFVFVISVAVVVIAADVTDICDVDVAVVLLSSQLALVPRLISGIGEGVDWKRIVSAATSNECMAKQVRTTRRERERRTHVFLFCFGCQ